MQKGTLEIHSENILPIIKKWLYSDRDIFVRELISNACDASEKVKILQDRGEIASSDEEFRIDVKIDKEAGTLTFSDVGIGMDAEEVKKYIAQIAFSGAEEFISKYQSNKEGEQFIGHFGLGFFSAYMVADKVVVETLSYKPGAEPVRWECDGSSDYEMSPGSRQTRGTDIILFIGKEHEECLDSAYIKKIISHYCSFLPYPIYLDSQRINDHEPLWIKPASECTKEEYLKFYHYLYPFEEEPLFWVHLNVDYPFTLKGILYFPKIKRDADLNKSNVSLYCNRVFVSDNVKDIIPNYLMVLKGVIDSPDIPLNVSRSYLQMDKTVRQLSGHISKKVTDSLATLYKTDRERFVSVWQDVGIIVKLGILEDEKFYERAKEFLIWETTTKERITVQEYLERNGEKTNNKVYYTIDEKHTTHFLDIYAQKGIEVLLANHPLDNFLIQFLENKLRPVEFQRIDAEIHESIVDKSKEKTLLDAEGKTEAVKLADFFSAKLNDEHVTVEAKSLAAESIPAIIVIEEKQRRMRDYFAQMSATQGANNQPFPTKKTLVVNTNNPLVEAIHKLDNKNPELASELVKEVFALALLSHREMEPHLLNEFINRSNRILEALTKEAVKGS